MKHLVGILIFIGCFVSKTSFSQEYRCFDVQESMIYHGEFKVFSVALQGNLVIKKQNSSYRMAFFNDMGMTFFDAEIASTGVVSFKKIISSMDIFIVKNKLRKLFKTLFLPNARNIKEETNEKITLQNNHFWIQKQPLFYEHQSKNGKTKAELDRNSIDYPIYFSAYYGNDAITMKFTKTTEDNSTK